jgi:Fe-S-cluster containining protein
MAARRQNRKEDTIEVGRWNVERRLATARVEGRGPLAVADECAGHCCRHGVYASLPDRDRIMEYVDRILEAMDETQTLDVDEWFEEDIHEDEDFPGGVCVGTAVHNDKCTFLNGDGLCVLQMLEPSLGLPSGERLKPLYCRLFPLTTWQQRVEFDDLCDGVRPCCTLASDGPTRAVDAYAYEFKELLGEEGYDQFRSAAAELQKEQEAQIMAAAKGKSAAKKKAAVRSP